VLGRVHTFRIYYFHQLAPCFRASADLPDPKWPDVSFKKLLEIAFRDRLIRSLDHAVIKKLQGAL
jgi:hypothetical protein